jgi:hypothetical protein
VIVSYHFKVSETIYRELGAIGAEILPAAVRVKICNNLLVFLLPQIFCPSKAKELSSSAERDDIPFFKRLIL